MMMDYRPQQPGEHDFVYAARILRAVATSFDAMLANGSYSLAELAEVRSRLRNIANRTENLPPPAHGSDAALVKPADPPPAAPAATPPRPARGRPTIMSHMIAVEGISRAHAEKLLGEQFNEWSAAHPEETLYHVFEPVRYEKRYGDHNYDRYYSSFTFFYETEEPRAEAGQ